MEYPLSKLNHWRLPSKPAVTVTALAAACLLAFGADAAAQERMQSITYGLEAKAAYDSNVNFRRGGDSDFILSGIARAGYRRRVLGAHLGITGELVHENYLENSDMTDTNFNFGLDFTPNIGREDADWSWDLNTIISRRNEEDRSAGGRIETTTLGLSGLLRYQPNRRWSTELNGSYRDITTKGELLDREILHAGLSFYYHQSSKMAYFVSLSAEDRTATGGSGSGPTPAPIYNAGDSQSTTASVGVSGQILPKLSGVASVGVQFVDGTGSDGDATPYYSAGLDYDLNSTTSFKLNALRSVSDNSIDVSTEMTTITLTAMRQLRRSLSGSVFVDYTRRDYGFGQFEGGSDETVGTGLSFDYRLAGWAKVNLRGEYEDQTSTRDPIFEYDRTILSVSLVTNW